MLVDVRPKRKLALLRVKDEGWCCGIYPHLFVPNLSHEPTNFFLMCNHDCLTGEFVFLCSVTPSSNTKRRKMQFENFRKALGSIRTQKPSYPHPFFSIININVFFMREQRGCTAQWFRINFWGINFKQFCSCSYFSLL